MKLLSGALLTGALLAATLLLAARRASAHATLERSSPADHAQLAAGPSQVDLYFAEQLVQNRTGTFAIVFDGAGTQVSDEARVDGADRKHLVVPLRSALDSGGYVVFWKSTSDEDGGVSLGNFSFTVGQPAATPPAGQADGQVLVPDAEQARALSLPAHGSSATGAVLIAAASGIAAGAAAGVATTYALLRRRRPPVEPPRPPGRRRG